MSGTAAGSRLAQDEIDEFLRRIEADHARNTAAQKAAMAAEARTEGANAFGPPRKSPRKGSGRTSGGLIGGGLQDRGRPRPGRDVSPTPSRSAAAAIKASAATFEAALATRRAARAGQKTAKPSQEATSSAQKGPAPVKPTPAGAAPAGAAPVGPAPAKPTPPTGATSGTSTATGTTPAQGDWFKPFTTGGTSTSKTGAATSSTSKRWTPSTGRTLPTSAGGPSTANTTPTPAPAPAAPKPRTGRFAFGSAIVPADDDDPSLYPLLRRTLAPGPTTTTTATERQRAHRRRHYQLLTTTYDPLHPPADDADTAAGLALGVVPDARARRWREQTMRIGRWCGGTGHVADGVDELTVLERHVLDIYFRRGAVVRRVPVRGGAGRRCAVAHYWASRSRVRSLRREGSRGTPSSPEAQPAPAAGAGAGTAAKQSVKKTTRSAPVPAPRSSKVRTRGPGDSRSLATSTGLASAPTPTPTPIVPPIDPLLSRGIVRRRDAPRPASEDVGMADVSMLSLEDVDSSDGEAEAMEDETVEGYQDDEEEDGAPLTHTSSYGSAVSGYTDRTMREADGFNAPEYIFPAFSGAAWRARRVTRGRKTVGATGPARKGVRFGPLPTDEELGRQSGSGIRRRSGELYSPRARAHGRGTSVVSGRANS